MDDFGLMDVEHVNILIDQDDDDDEEDDCSSLESGALQPSLSIPSSSSSSSISSSILPSSSSSQIRQCCLCDSEPQILLLPCFHLCACQSCWRILEENGPNPKCPKCETVVASTKNLNKL